MSLEGIRDWAKLNAEWEKFEKRVIHLEKLIKTGTAENRSSTIDKKISRTHELTHEWLAELSNEIMFQVRQMVNEMGDQLKKYEDQVNHLEEEIELLRIELNRALGRGQHRKHPGRPLI